MKNHILIQISRHTWDIIHDPLILGQEVSLGVRISGAGGGYVMYKITLKTIAYALTTLLLFFVFYHKICELALKKQ